MKYQPSSISVAVLSGDSNHVTLDKSVLARLQFKEVRTFASLGAAHERLRQERIRLVLIDSILQDIDGLDCLRRLAGDRGEAARALVMVTTVREEGYVMDAIAAGCAGYVLRPYSVETLERHMRQAWNALDVGDEAMKGITRAKNLVWTQQYDQAIDAFEEMVDDGDQSERYFNLGMELLRKRKFGEAIQAFNRAVAINNLYAEAYQGLAYAHKGKGAFDAYQRYLAKAAEMYALQDKMQQLKKIFVEILKNDPQAVNPYNDLGVRLRREGDSLGALHAYNQALELTPEDESVHYNIAKANFILGERALALEHLEKALGLRPGFPEALELQEMVRKGALTPSRLLVSPEGETTPGAGPTLQLD